MGLSRSTALLLVIATAVAGCGSGPEGFWARGGAMEPTIPVGSRLMVDMTAYEDRGPDRGDIVLFANPSGRSTDGGDESRLVHRVIGIPGETIEIYGNAVFVDGAFLAEPYLSGLIAMADMEPAQVPPDHYFVMGDNRSRGGSADSRLFGPIPADLLRGRVEEINPPSE